MGEELTSENSVSVRFSLFSKFRSGLFPPSPPPLTMSQNPCELANKDHGLVESGELHVDEDEGGHNVDQADGGHLQEGLGRKRKF